jgi:outer membrane immunogenic protein
MKGSMIIGALALAAMTIPTGAADLRPITKAPSAVPPPPFSWTGCYIGGNIGAKWGSFDGEANVEPLAPLFPGGSPVPGASLAFSGSRDSEVGFIGGGQVGCQWQTGSLVLGVEGDFVATDIERTFVVPPGPTFPFATFGVPFVPGDTFRLQNDWQASIRGRLGWAFDRWMVYATGGVAWANVEVEAHFEAPFPRDLPGLGGGFASADKTLIGATVGGGFEYAFTPNLSFGLEYRFTKFDSENFGLGERFVEVPAHGPFFVSRPLAVNADLETHEVTARLNWRCNIFGGPY